MEDTARGTDIRRCRETIWDTVGAIRDEVWRREERGPGRNIGIGSE